MNLAFRVRTMLIPARGMLSSLPNFPEKTYSSSERKSLVIAQLEELAWCKYATLASNYSFVQPPYKGQAFFTLKELSPQVPHDDVLSAILRFEHVICETLERTLALSDEAYPDNRGDFSIRPHLYDHGVSFSFRGDYLLVKWLRPTVDMEEMSVTSYIEWLCVEYASRNSAPDTIRSRLAAIPMNEILKVAILPL